VSASSAAGLPGERPLDGSAPLRLDDPATAWLVTGGAVQVLAVGVGPDGRPAGRRRPLFAVSAGGALLPGAPDAPIALIAVAIEEDTSLAPVAAAALRERDAGPAGGAELVLDWFDALVRRTGALPGDQAALRARAEALARSPASWAEAEALQHALLERLATSFAEQDARREAQLERRGERERERIADVYGRLGALLGAERSHRPAAGADDDHVLAALQLVAARRDLELAAPVARARGSFADRVGAIARASGIRTAEVTLSGRWWREDCGPLLGRMRDDERPVALLPARRGRYEIVDPAGGEALAVDAAVAATLAPTAVTLYRPLPTGRVSGRDVAAFLLRPLRGDLVRLCAWALVAAALSLVTPLATAAIFKRIVPGLERGNLVWVTALLVVFAFASVALAISQQIALLRAEGRGSTDLQAALWDRLLDLPTGFFRRFSPGELTVRVMGIDQIRQAATAAVSTAVLAVPIGVANLLIAFVFAPRLALFGLVAIAAVLAAMAARVRYQLGRERRVQRASQELFQSGLEIVEAIGKLRVADAQRRAFARWAGRLGTLKVAFVDKQRGYVRTTAFLSATTALATLLIFAGAATLGPGAISGPTFLAFNAAFLQALAAVTGLSSVATFVAAAVPLYDQARPILEAERETSVTHGDVIELRGQVEISHVSLRYAEDAPLVLRDVSLRVAPGELVAVVGPSGSGKSSLMRVLLGFETPELGTVRFDGHDLESLDVRAVRRQMGVVLQSSRLLPGDVLTNIAGGRELSLDDAWHAARLAGMEDDIRRMPMGMQTVVSEGGSTFSGGQRQRLLIARAVAGHPRVLFFDEATSALDNRVQAEVADAIAGLRATRIVIAHRLSTIRRADRIVVLVDGRVVQEGTYEDLLEQEGAFRSLATRQLTTA
jgi:ATP-binding cassette subfamily C protein